MRAPQTRTIMLKSGGIGAWLVAIRPRTLPTAMAPVIVGLSLAYPASNFAWLAALAAMMGALLLQIASNIANDVFDFEHGKDTSERLGPVRAVQSGLLTPSQARAGLAVVLAMCMLIGSYLVYRSGWPILVVGVVSMIAAVAYTAGPYPLGYHGLGELFVFIFFGPVAVVGTQYAISQVTTPDAYLASLSLGALATNILVVNNLRDRSEDARTGKRTLAVRFGERFTLALATSMLLLAYASPLYFWLSRQTPWPLLLPALTLPLAVLWWRRLRTVRGKPMNGLLAQAAQLVFFFGVLYAVGLLVP